MSVHFDDHSGFQRAALWSAAGGAALGVFGTLPLALAGSAAAVSLSCAADHWRNRILAAAACGAAAVLWSLAPHWWSPWACGATLALLLAAIRAGSARAAGARAPGPVAVGLTVAAGAAAVALGSELLPAASGALAMAAPSWIAAGVSGAVLGLWAAVCSAPLHLTVDRDPPKDLTDRDLRDAEALSLAIESYLRKRA